MGIANTAAAALVCHKISGIGLDVLTGRGTGLDDAGLAHKRAVLERAAARTGTLTPGQALAEYGGFEIAMMAGAMEAAAEAQQVVLVDGFIATAAALVVVTEAPALAPAFVYAHRSAEAGHRAVLDHLGAEPLLDLGLQARRGNRGAAGLAALARRSRNDARHGQLRQRRRQRPRLRGAPPCQAESRPLAAMHDALVPGRWPGFRPLVAVGRSPLARLAAAPRGAGECRRGRLGPSVWESRGASRTSRASPVAGASLGDP